MPASCLYPAYILPISCRYPADLLLISCLYPAYILLISCLYPAYILRISCQAILPISCPYPVYILPISCLYPGLFWGWAASARIRGGVSKAFALIRMASRIASGDVFWAPRNFKEIRERRPSDCAPDSGYFGPGPLQPVTRAILAVSYTHLTLPTKA